MVTDNLNKKYLLVGLTGTGKTYTALQLAAKRKKRLIVVDEDNNPAYLKLPSVPLESVPTYSQSNSFRIITPDVPQALNYLDMYHANAFIIMEDCGKYLSANIDNDTNRFLKNHRHRNFDVAMMFHYLNEVPPRVCNMHDFLLLFKTGEDEKRSLTKFGNWHVIKQAVVQVAAAKDYHKFLIVPKA